MARERARKGTKLKTLDESAVCEGTKEGTKSQQGLRALVPPPMYIGGAQEQTPGRAGKKRSRKSDRVGPSNSLELDPRTMYSFVLPYPTTSGNHAVKHGAGRHYRTTDAGSYRTRVKFELSKMGMAGSRWRPITKLRVKLALCPPDEKARDIDNVLKELCDALTKAGFWVDDSNRVIRSLQVDWLPALDHGAVHVTVSGWAP